MMDLETFLSAEEALALGFIDKVYEVVKAPKSSLAAMKAVAYFNFDKHMTEDRKPNLLQLFAQQLSSLVNTKGSETEDQEVEPLMVEAADEPVETAPDVEIKNEVPVADNAVEVVAQMDEKDSPEAEAEEVETEDPMRMALEAIEALSSRVEALEQAYQKRDDEAKALAANVVALTENLETANAELNQIKSMPLAQSTKPEAILPKSKPEANPFDALASQFKRFQ